MKTNKLILNVARETGPNIKSGNVIRGSKQQITARY